VANRIELRGKLTRAPLLRVTPAGTALLRLMVECGSPGSDLTVSVVMTGEQARTLAADLAVGRAIRATGSLRSIGGQGGQLRNSIEVVADEIALVAPD
jgi:primosomal replication protein N